MPAARRQARTAFCLRVCNMYHAGSRDADCCEQCDEHAGPHILPVDACHMPTNVHLAWHVMQRPAQHSMYKAYRGSSKPTDPAQICPRLDHHGPPKLSCCNCLASSGNQRSRTALHPLQPTLLGRSPQRCFGKHSASHPSIEKVQRRASHQVRFCMNLRP